MGRQAIIPEARRARCYTPKCKRDADVAGECGRNASDAAERERERERGRKREFRFRAHALPYKRNLMGQLNRYYRAESTSGSLTFDPLLSDVNLIIFAPCGRIPRALIE